MKLGTFIHKTKRIFNYVTFSLTQRHSDWSRRERGKETESVCDLLSQQKLQWEKKSRRDKKEQEEQKQEEQEEKQEEQKQEEGQEEQEEKQEKQEEQEERQEQQEEKQ